MKNLTSFWKWVRSKSWPPSKLGLLICQLKPDMMGMVSSHYLGGESIDQWLHITRFKSRYYVV